VIRVWARALLLAVAVPFVPNDPGFEANRAPLEAMSVPQAWSLTEGDPAVVIAVIDSGIAPDPDLDLVTGNASTLDPTGHGTALALIAAAQIDNGIGGAGICGRCRVMPADDIGWALDHGADVIDIGSCPHDASLDPAIAEALAHGVPVFTCAGDAVKVGTAGVVRARTDFVPSAGGLASATAALAGIAGLMLSCNPALTPAEVEQILVRTADEGEVNAYRAVERAGCRANPAAIVRLMVEVRGHGTVTRRPDDDTYNAGTVVVLRAKASPHWRFARWVGVCAGKPAVCTVRLTQSGVTTAVFKRK
jgi:subtilisin family serine protease